MGDLNEMVERLKAVIAEEADEYEADAAEAYERGERPDLWEREVTVPVAWASQAAAALTSLIAERDGLREKVDLWKATASAEAEAMEDQKARAIAAEAQLKAARDVIEWASRQQRKPYGVTVAIDSLSLDTNKGDGV